MKNLHEAQWEHLCVLYIYYYPETFEEPASRSPASAPERALQMDPDAPHPPAIVPDDTSMSEAASVPVERMEMEDALSSVIPQLPQKRETPPSPTPSTMPLPEKKLRLDHHTQNEKKDLRSLALTNELEGHFSIVTKEYQNLHTLHWLMDRQRRHRLYTQDLWEECYVMPKWYCNLTMKDVLIKSLHQHAQVHRVHEQYLVHWPGHKHKTFFVDMASGGSFASVTAEDNIAEKDLPSIWPQVEEADAKEIAQFVHEKAFQKIRLSEVPPGTVIVDGTWVRRWKMKSGSRIIKSRMCARGCFDPQKDSLATRSTTASRLSQRILMSTAAVMHSDPESWDVSGAFLKGLSFDRIREILLKQGIKSPARAVVLIPPWNTWRHLAAVDNSFQVNPEDIPLYGLWCLKPIYGLNDAPVAWQLSLGEFLKKTKGHPSKLDDSFFFWKDPRADQPLLGALTTHVDDLAVVGSKKFKDQLFKAMCDEFGQISRDALPFAHCGCQYSKTTTGYCIDQTAFASRLKPSDNPEGSDERDLTPSELTQFRSVLGGLLWLCSTRLDIVAEVGTLQSVITKAKVKHLRQANQLVKKACAKDKLSLGLHYRFFEPGTKMRLQCIHDASSASKDTSYAQEGMMILLMPELPPEMLNQDDITCGEPEIQHLSNYGHLLFAHGGKAKRVSYSTSHAETLSAIGGLEASSMVSIRMTELWIPEPSPSLKLLTEYQEQGSTVFPVDTATDCRDFFELCTGARSVPQDKLQRLYILAFKEARATGRLRYIILTPTEYMLADGLTKTMTAPKLLQYLSTGYVEFGNVDKHSTLLRRLPVLHDLTENDLYKSDQELWEETWKGRKTSTSTNFALMTVLGLTQTMAAKVCLAFTMLSLGAQAQVQEPVETPGDWMFWIFIVLAYLGLRSLEGILTWAFRKPEKTRKKAPRTPSPSSSESPMATSRPMRTTPSPSIERRTLSPEFELSRRSSGSSLQIPDKIWVTTTGDTFHLSPTCNGLARSNKASVKRLCKHCSNRHQASSGVGTFVHET